MLSTPDDAGFAGAVVWAGRSTWMTRAEEEGGFRSVGDPSTAGSGARVFGLGDDRGAGGSCRGSMKRLAEWSKST